MTRGIGPAEEIFFALADLNAHDREVLLEQRCGHDPRLRAEVDALLTALEAPEDGFLDPTRMPSLDLAAADGPLQPGTTLGDLLVLHAIGSGGMGVVYAAQQDRPRRTVAIKVLRRGLRHPEILRRFEREAEILARLQHPGIAQVFAFHPGDPQVPAHLVMELVSGPPITEYAHAQSLDLARRLELLIAVCQAVQHAHDRGIVHRDLKPANVLIDAAGQPKVLDFGIARVTGLDLSTFHTSHGQFLGTFAYMSPEQLRGIPEMIDARSDVYALGVLTGRLVTGRLPMPGTADPALTGPIGRVVARAMSQDRGRRYQSAAQLAVDLHACRDGHALAADDARNAAAPAGRVMTTESLDGRFIALGLTNGTVVILDAASGLQLAMIPGNGASLERLLFEDGAHLTIGRAGTQETIDVTTIV